MKVITVRLISLTRRQIENFASRTKKKKQELMQVCSLRRTTFIAQLHTERLSTNKNPKQGARVLPVNFRNWMSYFLVEAQDKVGVFEKLRRLPHNIAALIE